MLEMTVWGRIFLEQRSTTNERSLVGGRGQLQHNLIRVGKLTRAGSHMLARAGVQFLRCPDLGVWLLGFFFRHCQNIFAEVVATGSCAII